MGFLVKKKNILTTNEMIIPAGLSTIKTKKKKKPSDE